MKRVALFLFLFSGPLLMLLLLLMLLPGSAPKGLAGSIQDEAALQELLALRKYGVPVELIMSTTTVLQEAAGDESPSLTQVALEWLEIVEVQMVVDCDCSEESHCGCMPAEGEEATSCSCPLKPAGIRHYTGRTAIETYIGNGAENLQADTLHQAVQSAANAKSSDSTAYETLLVAVDRPAYESRLEAAGIAKALDRRSLMDVYEAAYFADYINTGAAAPAYYGNYSMPATGAVTSTYGMRLHPVKKRPMFHEGIDLGTAHHTPIHSVAAGVVTDITIDPDGDGQIVTIFHKDENIPFYTKYGHLSRIDVAAGQQVAQGQVIGLEGGNPDDPAPGLSTGHHLHFEALLPGDRLISPFAILAG